MVWVWPIAHVDRLLVFFLQMLMRLSPLLGERCGFDVEALYNKYKDGSKQSPRNETSEEPRAARKTSSALDDIQICASCQGYGLVKQHYSFTVKDVKCQKCDGDGVVQKC